MYRGKQQWRKLPCLAREFLRQEGKKNWPNQPPHHTIFSQFQQPYCTKSTHPFTPIPFQFGVMESKLIHESIHKMHKVIQHEVSSTTPRQAMALITPELLQTVSHTVIIWTLHFPLLWTLSWVTESAECLQWPAGLHINLNMNLRWKPEIARCRITPRWLVMGLKHGWNRDRECCRMRLRSRRWVKGMYSFFKKKWTWFTYTYLPNGLGAGNHLGEGRGRTGMEQGGQSLHNRRACPYFHLFV